MKKFTVERGRHYCNWFWTKFFCPRFGKNKWDVTFVMPKENWWAPPRNPDDYDINKEYGVCFGAHHENSWRLGWVPIFEKQGYFNLYAYTYDGGPEHVSKLIGEIEGDKKYTVNVESIGQKYWFTSLDLGVFIDMPNIYKDWWLQFDLWSYMGGNNKSPKKMTFNIDFKAH